MALISISYNSLQVNQRLLIGVPPSQKNKLKHVKQFFSHHFGLILHLGVPLKLFFNQIGVPRSQKGRTTLVKKDLCSSVNTIKRRYFKN